MIKFNYFIFAFFLSLTIHIIFVYQIQKQNEIDEIFVLDLASYKEFKPRKVELQKPIIKEVKKPEKKIEQKKIEQKKIIEKTIPINEKKKIENIKPLEKVEQTKVLEKKEEPKKIKKVEEVLKKKEDANFNQKKTLQSDKKKRLLANEQMKSFLVRISEDINKIANKSYPIQSIKRREQGTFNVLIVLNSNGELLELKFENKRPKRLYEKTKQILKSYKFPKPPSAMFIDTQILSIKIPVNYILR